MNLQSRQLEAIQSLKRQIQDTRQRVNRLDRREAFSAAQAMIPYTFSNLPAADSSRETWTVYVTDGRKQGETSGNGTGCPAYCSQDPASPGTYKWLRYSDDSPVAT